MKKYFVYIFISSFFVANFAFADNTQNDPKLFITQMENNLQLGKTNDDVKFLQKTLNDFGYFESDSDNPVFDGKFDQTLTDALTDFQRSNQIKATGKIDDYTIKTLNDFIKWEGQQNQGQSVVDDSSNTNLVATDTPVQYSNGGEIHDGVFLNKNALTYYLSKIPGLKAIGDAVDTFFGVKATTPKYDIFDCFTDPNCFLAK